MARNGSDVYQKPTGTTAVANTPIASSSFNQLMDDFASDLNLPRPIVAGGTGASTATTARDNLGLSIGSNVLAYDAGLAAIAGLTFEADKAVYSTGPSAFDTYTLTASGRTFLAADDVAAQQLLLGLGTAATKVAGTTAGEVLLLAEDDKLPALDGSLLTGMVSPWNALSWVSVTGSRVGGTSYENDTGGPIQWIVQGSSAASVQLSPDDATWVTVGSIGAPGAFDTVVSCIVPDGYFYRTSGSFSRWSELR